MVQLKSRDLLSHVLEGIEPSGENLSPEQLELREKLASWKHWPQASAAREGVQNNLLMGQPDTQPTIVRGPLSWEAWADACVLSSPTTVPLLWQMGQLGTQGSSAPETWPDAANLFLGRNFAAQGNRFQRLY